MIKFQSTPSFKLGTFSSCLICSHIWVMLKKIALHDNAIRQGSSLLGVAHVRKINR
jgi:hypothetical protein